VPEREKGDGFLPPLPPFLQKGDGNGGDGLNCIRTAKAEEAEAVGEVIGGAFGESHREATVEGFGTRPVSGRCWSMTGGSCPRVACKCTG